MLRYMNPLTATHRISLIKTSHPTVRGAPHYVRRISWTSVLLPTATFSGLLGALWIYKCLVMVIFQNKIIYMPNIPPFSRSERISDYRYPKDVLWREESFQSVDGVKLSVAIGVLRRPGDKKSLPDEQNVVLYFQG